jgi:hypothetical protein
MLCDEPKVLEFYVKKRAEPYDSFINILAHNKHIPP